MYNNAPNPTPLRSALEQMQRDHLAKTRRVSDSAAGNLAWQRKAPSSKVEVVRPKPKKTRVL